MDYKINQEARFKISLIFSNFLPTLTTLHGTKDKERRNIKV